MGTKKEHITSGNSVLPAGFTLSGRGCDKRLEVTK